jgi:hypothetical protein
MDMLKIKFWVYYSCCLSWHMSHSFLIKILDLMLNVFSWTCAVCPAEGVHSIKEWENKSWADWGIVMSVFVSRGDSQRVLYRPVNHMTAGSIATRFQLVQSHTCSSNIQSFFDTVSSNISYCRVRLKGHTYSWVTCGSAAKCCTVFGFPSKHFGAIKIFKYVSEVTINNHFVHLSGLGHQLLG